MQKALFVPAFVCLTVLAASRPDTGKEQFEVRQGEHLTVSAPAFEFDAGGDAPKLMARVRNSLVLQTAAGDVYVFSFKENRPFLALRTWAREIVQWRECRGLLVVSIASRHYTVPID